jgi:hypothetical protein
MIEGYQYFILDDYALFEYIKQNLFICDPNDKNDFKIRHSKICESIPKVVNKERLASFLTSLISKISPYDYESLIFVFTEILKLNSDENLKRNILCVELLQKYDRLNPPSKLEVDFVIEPDFQLGLSKLKDEYVSVWNNSLQFAQKRLAYHFLVVNPKEVLCEVNDNTIHKLLPLAHTLSISSDLFYESIIQQKIALLEHIKSSDEDEDLKFKTKNITFSDFKVWISKIKCYELALSTTVHVAGTFPRGEDRMYAYKTSLMFADRWVSSLEKEKV